MDSHFFITFLSFSIIAIPVLWFVKTSLYPTKSPPLPPGPRGLPILGYLPFLGHNLLAQLTDLGHKYGPIYQLYLGHKPCVVISSPSLVKEVVRDQDPVFANRDPPVAALTAFYDGNDIVWAANNSVWRSMRKIVTHEMMSSTSLDGSYNLRKDEVRKAIRGVYDSIGKPVDVGQLLLRTTVKMITSMLWGGTMEGEKGKRVEEEFGAVIKEIIDLIGKPNISDFYPILGGFDFQGIKRKMKGYRRRVDRIFDDVIAQHERIVSQDGNNFLQILMGLEQNQFIRPILLDMVLGGTDTVSTTLEWAMAELINNPKILRNAQEELSNIVGLNNIVEEFHVSKLEYLNLVIKETLRLHPIVPLLAPRSPSQSSIVGGYTVQKNTRVMINVASIQRDPSFWNDPVEFKPERFLEGDGKWDYSGNNFHYFPFGSGRRICVGLPLAERMLMYLLASLLHSFEWKLEEGQDLDMSETFGIMLRKTIPLVVIPSARLYDPQLYL